MRYQVEIRVTPREGLLDPQGRAVESAVTSLGFEGVGAIRMGKLVHMQVEADSDERAAERAREICDKLVANPVIEDYEVRVLGEADTDGRTETRGER